MDAGTTYAFGIVGTVPEAFDHPELGLVGLHVMYRAVRARRGLTQLWLQ